MTCLGKINSSVGPVSRTAKRSLTLRILQRENDFSRECAEREENLECVHLNCSEREKILRPHSIHRGEGWGPVTRSHSSVDGLCGEWEKENDLFFQGVKWIEWDEKHTHTRWGRKGWADGEEEEKLLPKQYFCYSKLYWPEFHSPMVKSELIVIPRLGNRRAIKKFIRLE